MNQPRTKPIYPITTQLHPSTFFLAFFNLLFLILKSKLLFYMGIFALGFLTSTILKHDVRIYSRFQSSSASLSSSLLSSSSLSSSSSAFTPASSHLPKSSSLGKSLKKNLIFSSSSSSLKHSLLFNSSSLSSSSPSSSSSSPSSSSSSSSSSSCDIDACMAVVKSFLKTKDLTNIHNNGNKNNKDNINNNNNNSKNNNTNNSNNNTNSNKNNNTYNNKKRNKNNNKNNTYNNKKRNKNNNKNNKDDDIYIIKENMEEATIVSNNNNFNKNNKRSNNGNINLSSNNDDNNNNNVDNNNQRSNNDDNNNIKFNTNVDKNNNKFNTNVEKNKQNNYKFNNIVDKNNQNNNKFTNNVDNSNQSSNNVDSNKFNNYHPPNQILPDPMYWRQFAKFRQLHSLPFSATRKPILLCWVMTDVDRIVQLKPAQLTWLSRCDLPLVFSTGGSTNFPSINIPGVAPGRATLAAKSKYIWSHVFKYYATLADYFIKADPDSFIFVDVLKRYLQAYNHTDPIFMGHGLFMDRSYDVRMHYFKGVYSAGAGILLSRGALVKLATVINKCPLITGTAEDLKTSICLKMAGVYLMDTRDLQKREIFLPPFPLHNLLKNKLPDWYRIAYRKSLGVCQDIHCLNPLPTVLHYVDTYHMFTLNFFDRTINTLLDLIDSNDKSFSAALFRMNGSVFNQTF